MKNTKIVIHVLVYLCLSVAFSQTKTNFCDCENVFNETVSKLEANYLVYKKMELNRELSEYTTLKKQFNVRVKNVKPTQCTEIINKFLRFFNDGHLFVMELPKHDSISIAKYKKNIKSNKLKISKLKKLLALEVTLKVVNKGDEIIGTYTDGISEIVVIKENKGYKAYILSSQKETVAPGELKATFAYDGTKYLGTYYTYKYQPKHVQGVLFKEGTILSLNAVIWAKTKSKKFSREVRMVNPKSPDLPLVQKLDAKNVVLSIPSFLANYEDFVSVIQENLDVLANAENLIIDVRGNTGGNAMYFSFIEFYASKDVLPVDKQGEVLASEDTKAYYRRLSQYSEAIYGEIADRIEKNIGLIIPGPKYLEQKLERYPSKIKNVAIITDGATASAAESFILHSKKVSNKVITFGSPTFGMIDYTSVNSIKLKSSNNQNIYFGYPTSSLGKIDDPKYPNGYNERGILPDVPIDKTVNDKIQYIIEYYNEKS